MYIHTSLHSLFNMGGNGGKCHRFQYFPSLQSLKTFDMLYRTINIIKRTAQIVSVVICVRSYHLITLQYVYRDEPTGQDWPTGGEPEHVILIQNII